MLKYFAMMFFYSGCYPELVRYSPVGAWWGRHYRRGTTHRALTMPGQTRENQSGQTQGSAPYNRSTASDTPKGLYLSARGNTPSIWADLDHQGAQGVTPDIHSLHNSCRHFVHRVRGSRSSRLPTEPCVRVRTRLLILYSYPSTKR